MIFKQVTAYDTSAKATPAQSKMNEQRAFPVVVTGCCNCPHRINSKHSRCELDPLNEYSLVEENKDAITPSCPMYDQSKPIGELK